MKKHRVVSGIVTGSLVLAFLTAPVNAASLTEQLAQSNARQAAAKYQVDMTQNTINGIEDEIGKVNEEVNRINGIIGAINADISSIEANIAKKQEELKIAEAKKQEQEAAMSDRVRAMYMYGNGSIMEFIFSASDFSDFITKLDMSRYIMTADKDSLNALEETKKVIDEKKLSIEADRLKTVAKKTEQEVVLTQQEEVLAQKDQLLAQNQAALEEYKAIEAAEAATSADIEGQLQAYYEQQRAAAEQAAQNNGSTGTTDGSTGGDTTNTGGGDTTGGGSTAPPVYSSSYVWPCGGEITSEFGWRIHPIWGDSRFHAGVDIGASTGTPVACAGNGTVISAGWNGGYGNCVIVDIGNGLSAVYAHLSAINVSSGETVAAGQTVGAVGSTGDSTGAHLHYEVRLYGSPISPYI
ncbi:peptidoglycan DD-metalloendopeptidase family protein [Acetobacterium wieringae]|uniref:Peptidoglycan DD-metalloendopeptidase family protein n=1 Tax=Acetobacterium wieringae TaxID=52694 RepID=A0ABY6HHM0_9FIRM|nr:M23 family metallopeptidase [Acetobacterium wieringae]MEA4804434.1 peptidoglycan DD-metalloendopeptidase family protein [Acetobacterium wieringae]UYO63780.1 peptidoglycan DD-metalloendopeptidase family protein [Acetobacterium wieringae]VUZ27339.1 Murein hydrolase activator EnvC [Acetobacterium wieringae]